MDVNEVDVGVWLDATDLVVVVGAGGVGKTTTAASVGLQAALRGRKVVVLTIDPARRLANSLGLAEFGNEARKIDLTSSIGHAAPCPSTKAPTSGVQVGMLSIHR